MDDLLQEFIAETRETLEALSGEIVAWEARPDDRDRLDAIFRFVHTVKGSCGFLDLPRLARLSHAAEDVLAAVRSGERVPDTRLVSAVLAIVDRIGELVEAIDAGHPLDDSGEDLLIAGLDKQSTIVAPTPASAAVRAPTRSVRLNVDLLDRMMSGMSDMVLARNELARRLRVDGADPTIEASLERLSLTVAEMRDTVTRTRMQKIDALFSALPRMVRDTAAELGKAVRLDVEGSDVELDREMIEMMRDPLVHIVRNSIDHGIESPAERAAAGKRNEGRLTVSARQSGNQIIIEIADDGRGIDVERLITKVAKQGGRSEAELRALNPKAKLDLVFEAGISTKDVVTAVSGRGVGMDVVRANVEQIGGRIDLTSVQGVGLRIAIHVPLTLSIIATIGVGVGDQRFAISRQAIEEIVRVGGDTIRIDMLGNTPAATIRDRRMPLVNLARALGIDPSDTAATPVAAMLVIVSVSGGSYALAVDSVLDHEELVIKPATPAVMASGVYAGQTLPDSGLPMLLLDCGGVAASAGLQFTREVAADDDIQGVEEVGTSALLFEDLDGVRRLVPLEVVDRIDPVPVDAIRFTAGRLHLSVDDRIIPLSAIGDWSGRHSIPVLRLRDGAAELGYAISEALDIVTLPTDLIAAREVGQIAGVVMLGGEQIELLDLHYLFADLDKSDRTTQPLCLIGGVDAGWIATFLSPAVEAAGYRVSRTLRAGEVPTIIMMMDDDVPLNEQHPQAGAGTARGEGSAKEEGPGLGATPVVRLRRERGGGNDGGIYRYDRAAIVAELARQSDRSDGVAARSAGGR